jgi:magnesium-transporting ATPase (P-type)
MYGGTTQLCQRLKTDTKRGLTSDAIDLEQRRKVFGRNEIPAAASRSFLGLAWDALHDTTLIVLIVCAVISLALSFYVPPPDEGEAPHIMSVQYLKSDVHTDNLHDITEETAGWIEGVAIFLSVVVVVLVTATTDYTKEKQFRSLQERIKSDHNYAVVRNGEQVQINVSDICVGDICAVKYGDLLPADGVVIQSNDLKVDESSMTGETDDISKSAGGDPMLLSGER